MCDGNSELEGARVPCERAAQEQHDCMREGTLDPSCGAVGAQLVLKAGKVLSSCPMSYSLISILMMQPVPAQWGRGNGSEREDDNYRRSILPNSSASLSCVTIDAECLIQLFIQDSI